MKILFSILIFLCCSLPSDMNAQERRHQGPPSQLAQGYSVGDQASDFNLKNVDDAFYSLAGLQNAKGYIVVFTSNVCPFALLYEDRLIKLHRDMAAQGYPVVAINANDATIQEGDSFDDMKIRAAEKGFPFLYLDDQDQTVFPQFGATKTPHVFLLDQKLIVRYIGAIDDNAKNPTEVKEQFVRNAVAALERGEMPTPSETKAVGCSIKAKAGHGNANAHPPKGERRGPPSPAKILEMMDKNQDQKVSLAEAQGPLKRDFNRIDENEDGFLTVEELSKIKGRGPR